MSAWTPPAGNNPNPKSTVALTRPQMEALLKIGDAYLDTSAEDDPIVGPLGRALDRIEKAMKA